MHVYSLSRETQVAADIEMVWRFLSNPRNLNQLTPPGLRFAIISDPPDTIYEGLIIEYRVRIPLFGTWTWLSEIKHIREKQMFVDEQRLGPYAFWYHSHRISETGNGILIIDDVRYAMPFLMIGRLVHYFRVGNMLQEIFDFRESKLLEILGKPSR